MVVRRIIPLLLTLTAVICLTRPVGAHETDQYTLPEGRDFADLGPYLNQWAYNAIQAGVKAANEQISAAAEAGRNDLLDRRMSDLEVATLVNKQFPIALFVIEDLNHLVKSPQAQAQVPGHLVGYQTTDTIRTKIELPLNPLNAWGCATIKVYDVYVGTDKVGHFTDMGMHYYRAYRKALDGGADTDAAILAATSIGTDGPILSEKGILGYVTAGAYSNADLVANYMGLQFYRNLTEPVMLQGKMRPPMLQRDGLHWTIAPHVRPDNDFLAVFMSEHLNEVLNPSHYLPKHQHGIRDAIRDRREIVLERYVDPNGNRRPARWFADKAEELSTYYGQDYGHLGEPDQLLTLDRVCYTSFHPSENLAHRGRDGQTSLHVAAAWGDLSCLKRFIASGADINARIHSREDYSSQWGMTPLHLAAQNNQIDAARMLIKAGAQVNARSDRGVTPLHMAIGHPQMIELLLDSGARIALADQRGRTALHWAAYDPDSPAMDLLIAHGADVNAQDHDGETPLHRAVRADNVPAAKALLTATADPGVGDSFGITPLHLATDSKDLALAALLVESGAPVNASDSFGCTPLHEATRVNSPATAALLLDNGASASIADAYGGTPLHLAGRLGCEQIARLLLDHGADAQARAHDGGTPADTARRAGRDPLVRLLESYQPRTALNLAADADE